MAETRLNLLQGTLDMLILKILEEGERKHGYEMVRRIQQITDNTLQVEEGSLYPCLHRMEKKKWIESEWGLSENNRRAKYYRLTDKGKKQLQEEISVWESFSGATMRILQLSPGT